MWITVLKFLTGAFLPAMLKAYQQKLLNDTNSDKILGELTSKALDLDAREAEFNNQYRISLLGRWWEPVNLLGYLFLVYLTSAVLWDNVLYPKFYLGQWGYTGPVEGNTAVYIGMVATFFLGKRVGISLIEVVAKYIKR